MKIIGTIDQANLKLIKEHNFANNKFTVALNKCAIPIELKALLGFKADFVKLKVTQRKSNADSLDWRTKGVVKRFKE